MINIAIITISDRASKGIYEDISGPEIERILLESGKEISIEKEIVPDEKNAITEALKRHLNCHYILTTGGTGISRRDITPEVCQQFCDKELPGIAEILRSESYKETPNALFSRGYAGIKEKTIIINFPGSVKAVRLCTGIILPILEHGTKMMDGEGH